MVEAVLYFVLVVDFVAVVVLGCRLCVRGGLDGRDHAGASGGAEDGSEEGNGGGGGGGGGGVGRMVGGKGRRGDGDVRVGDPGGGAGGRSFRRCCILRTLCILYRLSALPQLLLLLLLIILLPLLRPTRRLEERPGELPLPRVAQLQEAHLLDLRDDVEAGDVQVPLGHRRGETGDEGGGGGGEGGEEGEETF